MSSNAVNQIEIKSNGSHAEVNGLARQAAELKALANDEIGKHNARIVAAARAVEAKAREAEEKFRQVESRLEAGIAQRLAAEQRIRELELEGRKRLEIEEALAVTENRLREVARSREDLRRQLLARFETERTARQIAEHERDQAQIRACQAQTDLIEAAEKHARAEARYEELVQHQQIELRELETQITGDAAPKISLYPNSDELLIEAVLIELDAGFRHSGRAPATQRGENQMRVMSYGVAIVVLLFVLVALSVVAYQQL